MPAFAPVPKSADTKPATYGNDPVASGPYEVESNKPGTAVTLVRNPEWSTKTDEIRTGGPDKVVFKLSQDDTVAAQQLIADSGEPRTPSGPGSCRPRSSSRSPATRAPRSASHCRSPVRSQYLALNNRRPGLKDVQVRQAIEYAVDKRAFQLASGGAQGGELASTLITPGIPGRRTTTSTRRRRPVTSTKAKQLLARRGRRT